MARRKSKQHHIHAMYLGFEKTSYGDGSAHAIVGRLREHANAQAVAADSDRSRC
jgi:hypothetical protein